MKVSEQIAIMKAYEDGKTIERRAFFTSAWKIIDYVENHQFDFASYEYRIKPEPKYRPYKSVDEAFNDAKKHGFWMRNKNDGALLFIDLVCKDKDGDTLICDCSADEILDDDVWLDDGSPCGVKIE